MISKSVLDIDFDIDAHLDSGGTLLDLRMLSAVEKMRLVARAQTETPEFLARVTRFGKFLSLVSAHGASKEKVGETLTEAHLRDLWRKTADLEVSPSQVS